MPITELNHFLLVAKNLERTRKFYENVLGLELADRPDFGFPGRWYGIGHGQLHLIQGDAPGGSLDPSGPHFAIAVEDLDAARRELASAGVETLDPGGAQLWLRDPDGNVIELTSAPL